MLEDDAAALAEAARDEAEAPSRPLWSSSVAAASSQPTGLDDDEERLDRSASGRRGSLRGGGVPYRDGLEGACLGDLGLLALAQLEEGEEGDDLLDAKPVDLVVEGEAAAGRSRLRKRSRKRESGGYERTRWRSDGSGGTAASERSATTSCAGSCWASGREGAARAARAQAEGGRTPPRAAPPASRGRAEAAVGGEALGQLLRGVLGVEALEVELLVREEPARLQLEQRGRQDQELAARLQVELVPLGQALDEGEDDLGDVDVSQLELLPQDEGEEEIEGPLECVEVEGSSRTAVAMAAMLVVLPDAALGDGHRRPLGRRRLAALLRPAALRAPLRPDEGNHREREDDDRDPGVQAEPEELVGLVDPQQLHPEAADAVPDDVEAEEARRPRLTRLSISSSTPTPRRHQSDS